MRIEILNDLGEVIATILCSDFAWLDEYYGAGKWRVEEVQE